MFGLAAAAKGLGLRYCRTVFPLLPRDHEGKIWADTLRNPNTLSQQPRVPVRWADELQAHLETGAPMPFNSCNSAPKPTTKQA